MINKAKRLLVGCAIFAFGTSYQMFAQDALGALLQDLNGGEKDADAPAVAEEKPAAAAPAAAAADADAAADAAAEDADADVDAQVRFEQGKLTTEDDALIAETVALEVIRRASLNKHGEQALEKARALLKAGDNMGAADNYKQALESLIKSQTNEALRHEAEAGRAEAYYNEARDLLKRYENDNAKSMAEKALQWGHPKASRLLETINKVKPQPPKATESIATRLHDASYVDRQDEIRKRLNKSRQYFMTAEYAKAMEECEIVLRDYPDTIAAIDLRKAIAKRMDEVAIREKDATHAVMIKDVDKAWTPETYARESSQPPKGKKEMGQTKSPTGGRGDTQTSTQKVNAKLRAIIIPEVSFRPPATIIDAVDFFKQASRDYDDPTIAIDQRGISIILKLPSAATDAAAPSDDVFAPGAGAAPGVPVINAMTARNISLYDALKLVCEVTGMKTRVMGNIVMIVPKDDPIGDLIRRTYSVLPSLPDRITSASSGLPKTTGGGGATDRTFMSTESIGGATQEEDWKKFFTEMGVVWPTGSSIAYALGKLRVTNTEDQLAIFEGILDELNVTEKLVEVEARFVEVAQEDLKSLGFEWLINGDYSFSAPGIAKSLLGLKNGVSTVPMQLTDANGTPLWADASGTVPLMGYRPYTKPGYMSGNAWGYDGYGNLRQFPIAPKSYGPIPAPKNNMLLNAIDGTTYSTGGRYLNTPNNPITGQNPSINDSFMRLNAFIGGADVSMILHMLSQQSDTDLLSAPKVTVSPDQEAIMKVVTEYIYPSEFNVQISQQGTSGGGYGTSGGTGEPVAIVEPQNFTMREVGVILQVIPKLSEDGQMITLSLRPQVVSEPVWKNYGTKLPKTVYTTDPITGLVGVPQTEYVELPMEQPFFNVRSVETQLTINNGATVVMGGLITEARTTIEDKIPLLGDIPYLGRLFRSRAEKTNKRNLLIFVTARTIDTSGRTIRSTGGDTMLVSSDSGSSTEVTPADK